MTLHANHRNPGYRKAYQKCNHLKINKHQYCTLKKKLQQNFFQNASN